MNSFKDKCQFSQQNNVIDTVDLLDIDLVDVELDVENKVIPSN